MPTSPLGLIHTGQTYPYKQLKREEPRRDKYCVWLPASTCFSLWKDSAVWYHTYDQMAHLCGYTCPHLDTDGVHPVCIQAQTPAWLAAYSHVILLGRTGYYVQSHAAPVLPVISCLACVHPVWRSHGSSRCPPYPVVMQGPVGKTRDCGRGTYAFNIPVNVSNLNILCIAEQIFYEWALGQVSIMSFFFN